jgi:hypothetical protein
MKSRRGRILRGTGWAGAILGGIFLSLLWLSGEAANPPPNCTDTGGNHLNYTSSNHTYTCGTSTSGVPSTLTSAHWFIGNVSNVASDVAMSGDCTVNNTGAITCTKTSGSTFAATATSNALSALATQAANTVVANVTGSTAVPTAASLPSCVDTAGNHLNYTNGTGFSCGTSGVTASLTVGSTVISSGTTGRVLYDNAGVLGESTTVAFLDTNQAWTKAQAVTPVALTPGAGTIAVDGSLSNGFTLTIGNDSNVLGNPTNLKAGQNINFQLTVGSGGHTGFSTGTNYKYAGGTAPTWSTAAAKIDVLSCWAVTTSVLECNGLIDVR